MHDIHLLEKQWEAYNKKRKRPLYLALLSFLVVLSALYTFVTWKKNRHASAKEQITVVQAESKSSPGKKMLSKVIIDKTIDRLDTYPAAKPKESTQDYPVAAPASMAESSPVEVVEDIPILKEESSVGYNRPAPPKNVIHVKKKPPMKKRKKIKLKIFETTSVSAYKDVERRFKLSHDIDDALFLARGYYRHGNYKKAEYWALQANKVDNTVEESWLIFIKSKYNLGQKSEAKHILESYIRKSGSVAARKLMKKLK